MKGTDRQPTRWSRIAAALQQWLPLWVPATAVTGAVVTYLTTQRREAGIIALFVRKDPVIPLVLGAVAVVAAVVLVSGRRGSANPLKFALAIGSRGFLRGVPLAMLAAAGLWLLANFVSVRYAVFSQTWFQERAIGEVRDGDMVRAARICDRYLDLYPQRRAGHALADPICLGITGDLRRVSRLADFIGQSPVPDASRPPPDTTFAYLARSEARHRLEWTTKISNR